MLPNVPFALFILLALLPGWVFVRLSERMGPRPERSSLAELLELAAVGFSALALAALIVAGLSLKGNSGLFNVESWAHTRHQYLGDHLGAALASTALMITLSCGLVIGLWVVLYARRTAGFKPGSSVWMDCLAPTPNGMCNYVGVYRRDGSLVEGLLFSFTAGPDDNPREISLKSPIRVTLIGGSSSDADIDRVIIPGDEITTLTVLYVPKYHVSDETSSPTTPSPPSS